MRNSIQIQRWLAVAGFLVLTQAPLLACATCFGKSDAPMAKGMNMGIMTLLVFVVVMWVGVGGFFYYISRRSARLAKENEKFSEQTVAWQHD